MDNALFYTFSTIAQTLAAAFALLGAFVLFKLQQVSSTLSESAETVVRPYLPSEEARRLLANGRFAELEAFLRTQELQRPEVIRPHTYAAAMSAFTGNIAAHAQIMRHLSQALLLTAVVVVAAVVVLTLTPLIAKSVPASVVVLSLGVAALLLCLFVYRRLVVLVVK